MHRAKVDFPHPVSPDEPEGLPTPHLETDFVDRLDAAHLVLEEDAFLDREVLDDALSANQDVAARGRIRHKRRLLRRQR